MTNPTPNPESIRKRLETACPSLENQQEMEWLVSEVDRLTREAAHHKLVNDILMRPTAGDVDEERQEVKSILMTMAVRVMAAATRLNPAAKNYGAWMVAAEREPDGTEEPGSGEDIRGWEIHICCVRPGGKSPMVLATERGEEIDRLTTALATAKDEERAAVVAETRHRAAEWESVGVKDDARVLREHADAIESGRHRGKA